MPKQEPKRKYRSRVSENERAKVVGYLKKGLHPTEITELTGITTSVIYEIRKEWESEAK